MGFGLKDQLEDILYQGKEVDSFTVSSREELGNMNIPSLASQVVLVPNRHPNYTEVYILNNQAIDIFGLGPAIIMDMPLTLGQVVEKASDGKENVSLLIGRHYDECGQDGHKIDVYVSS